jgi:hypothetical protein
MRGIAALLRRPALFASQPDRVRGIALPGPRPSRPAYRVPRRRTHPTDSWRRCAAWAAGPLHLGGDRCPPVVPLPSVSIVTDAWLAESRPSSHWRLHSSGGHRCSSGPIGARALRNMP